jgi:hypothetical protein
MPCLDGREHEHDDHAYKGARLLCKLLDDMTSDPAVLMVLPLELKEWWKEHKRIDAER